MFNVCQRLHRDFHRCMEYSPRPILIPPRTKISHGHFDAFNPCQAFSSFTPMLQIFHLRKSTYSQGQKIDIVQNETYTTRAKEILIRVGFEPTRFLTSKLIPGEPETSAITTRPSDQSMRSSKTRLLIKLRPFERRVLH